MDKKEQQTDNQQDLTSTLVNNEELIKEDIKQDEKLISEIQQLRQQIASMPTINMTAPVIPQDVVKNKDSILDEIGG